MNGFHDVDRDLVEAFAVELDADAYARTLEVTLARVEVEFIASASAPPPRRWHVRDLRPGRRRLATVVVAIVLILLLVAVAIAQPSHFDWIFGDDPDAPANKVEVLKEPKERATPAQPAGRIAPGVTMRSLLDPPTNADGDLAFLRGRALNIKRLRPPGTPGASEFLPLETYLRLLLDIRIETTSIQVIAVPTTEGKVCHWLWSRPVESFVTGCTAVLDEDQPVHGGVVTPRDRRPIAHGIFIDGVRSIRIRRSDGRADRATLGRNAYAWRSPRPDVRPTGLVVTFDDGRSVELSPIGGVLRVSS